MQPTVQNSGFVVTMPSTSQSLKRNVIFAIVCYFVMNLPLVISGFSFSCVDAIRRDTFLLSNETNKTSVPEDLRSITTWLSTNGAVCFCFWFNFILFFALYELKSVGMFLKSCLFGTSVFIFVWNVLGFIVYIEYITKIKFLYTVMMINIITFGYLQFIANVVYCIYVFLCKTDRMEIPVEDGNIISPNEIVQGQVC